jgi:hypothetical protein
LRPDGNIGPFVFCPVRHGGDPRAHRYTGVAALQQERQPAVEIGGDGTQRRPHAFDGDAVGRLAPVQAPAPSDNAQHTARRQPASQPASNSLRFERCGPICLVMGGIAEVAPRIFMHLAH